MTFVRNAWYAASWASELAHTLKHQTILGEDVVLYRTLGGRPAALRDPAAHTGCCRCPTGVSSRTASNAAITGLSSTNLAPASMCRGKL